MCVIPPASCIIKLYTSFHWASHVLIYLSCECKFISLFKPPHRWFPRMCILTIDLPCACSLRAFIWDMYRYLGNFSVCCVFRPFLVWIQKIAGVKIGVSKVQGIFRRQYGTKGTYLLCSLLNSIRFSII